ncbi:MAG: hypothetical protein OES13_02800 [Acidimicrobiia bacterium]|nr:hypothetical protein [Acidimicrobiia bacterium]
MGSAWVMPAMSRASIARRVKSSPGKVWCATEGLSSRCDAVAAALASQGGSVHDFWAVETPPWHVAFVIEGDQTAGQTAAGNVMNYGVGHVEDWLVLRLAELADVDAAFTQMAGGTPRKPGSD